MPRQGSEAPREVMHQAHGRSEGQRCGSCTYFVFLKQRQVTGRANPVNLFTCRQYPDRLVTVLRPPFAKSWDACGVFKPI